MQVEQAKIKLGELELNIEKLINDFQRETGMHVTGVYHDKTVSRDLCGNATYFTRLTVKAELK
jgi:hypothetical protein